MIKIGIVGCGRILAAHLRGYRILREAGVDDFEITALCARKESDAQSYVQRGEGPSQRKAVSDMEGDPLAIDDEYLSDFQPGVNVEVFTDYREMIARGAIDAVNDFTIHSLHHQVAEVAFQNGKHLMSQKPLAVTVRAARQMCERAEAAGVTFGVFENLRYLLGIRRTKWAFGPEGPLGDLQMALFGCAGAWWAPDQIVAETPWRHKLLEAGGIALDMGPHWFDMVRYVGGEVKSVSAQTSVMEPVRYTRDATGRVIDQLDCDADDTFFANFETVAGARGTIYGSWAGHGGATMAGEGAVFYGSKGRLSGDQLSLDDGKQQSLEAIHQPKTPLGLSDDFALAQHDWLEAIRTGTSPETSGEEGFKDLACAFAVVESAKAKREVEVVEVENGRIESYQEPLNRHFGVA
ncbi:MAG: Gfo/Idh/MocA family oxidoreductase [Verrucomicrobiota bacterium]